MLDLSIDSFHFYFLVAVIQGIILSLIIIFKKPISLPNILLGVLIFLFSISLLHGVLEEAIHAFNAEFPYPMDYGFAYGPLAYFHILFIAKPKFKFRRRQLLHFLPSLLIDVVFFMVFFNYISNHREWAYNHIQEIQLLSMFVIIVGIIQMIIYAYFIYKLIKTSNIKPKEFAISIKGWYQSFMASWVVIFGFLTLAIPIAIYNIELFDDNSYLIYKPLGTIIGICIYWLGYRYLLKYLTDVNNYIRRVRNMKFSPEEISGKEDELLHALKKEKIYTDDKLTVDKLAKFLHWPVKDVTIVINEAFETNFNDLINTYRINAFKELASKPESKKYSIIGIAQEVGFNSKASFYRAFKKVSGQTPTEFMASNGFK